MLTAAKTMTLTPRTYQGRCQAHLSPSLAFALSVTHSDSKISIQKKSAHTAKKGEAKRERQRGGGGHYLDETALDTVARANQNIALLSFNGDYTVKVQPDLILFNTAYNYIIVSVCMCVCDSVYDLICCYLATHQP